MSSISSLFSISSRKSSRSGSRAGIDWRLERLGRLVPKNKEEVYFNFFPRESTRESRAYCESRAAWPTKRPPHTLRHRELYFDQKPMQIMARRIVSIGGQHV